jgi:mRNA interferase MazF
MTIKQFDVLLVDFSPIQGSEQDGIRPAIVLQTNGLADKGNITLVAPLTTNLKKVYSFEVRLPPTSQNGLREQSKMLIRHIRSIDKKRIIKHMGHLEKKYHKGLLHSISVLFDINQDFC